MHIGLAAPHFSEHATVERLVDFAPTIERLGFHSLWVRDHISFEAGRYDPPGRRFVDPFIALAAIAGVTTKIRLGTAVVIPIRHPLVTAQLLGGLDWVSRGRVEVGLGMGGPVHQFEAVGTDMKQRSQWLRETVDLLRLGQASEVFDYHGTCVDASGISLSPALHADARIWYGGASKWALQRAHAYCDGVLPGRLPFARYDPALEVLRDQPSAKGRPMLAGSMPFVSLGSSPEDALARIDERARTALFSRYDAESAENLEGALIVGTTAHCVDELGKFAARAMELVVFDLRLRMDEFEEQVHQIAAEVLPAAARM